MSDIYLSLTETPSVVTLSQPVIATQVAATVTVGNTVTVALDANSLSALENVTVTVGAAVSVSNFPSTQAIAGTVTANGGNFLNGDNALITRDSASNIVLVGGLKYSATPTQSAINAIRTDGNGAVLVYSSQTNWTDTNAGNQPRSASQQTPFPVQVLGGSVTVGSLPAISGTVTANVPNADTFIKPNGTGGFGDTLEAQDDVSAEMCVAVHIQDQSGNVLGAGKDFPISGTVTANLSQSITEPIDSTNATQAIAVHIKDADGNNWGAENIFPVVASGTVTVGAMPNGALTTRFGTPTTASVAFATSCVTNANRKYLLIQNVTTGSNVITVGIGFTPTTTQGIQLTAGAGITFESSYIPTGAVYVLSSVTASNFTILEA